MYTFEPLVNDHPKYQVFMFLDSGAAFTLCAWAQCPRGGGGYLLGTNVNAPFLQVATLGFWHNVSAQACTWAQKWAAGHCVHSVIVSFRAKWSNYVQSHTLGNQGVNTKLFCAVTEALVSTHQVWTAP